MHSSCPFLIRLVFSSLDDDAIFSLDAGVGMRYQLTSWSSLNITYGHNLLSGTRDTLNEINFTTGLGVKW